MISVEAKNSMAKAFPKFREMKWRIEVLGKPKVFCIGRNKTGTTSVKRAFQDLGYRVGKEEMAYKYLHSYAKRDFKPIIKFCKTAQVFEDIPFSLPYTYQAMDDAYPGSKFILTIRDSADQWVKSLLNHHKRRFGSNGQLPTKDQLKKLYKTPGLNRWDFEKIKYDMTENDLYDVEFLKETYHHHNKEILNYFRHRKNDLLIINLSETGSYQRFCEFLGENPLYKKFPHLNRSQDL